MLFARRVHEKSQFLPESRQSRRAHAPGARRQPTELERAGPAERGRHGWIEEAFPHLMTPV